MVLFATAGAAVGELARRHGQEKSVLPGDQLDVADDERVIKRQRAKRFETISLVFAQFDPDVRQLRDEPQSERQALKKERFRCASCVHRALGRK